MKTLFSYRPRSGTKIFAENLDSYIVDLGHGNGSTTFVGDFVCINVHASYPGNHFRNEMRSFCEQFLSKIVGFALDDCGTITLGVPHSNFTETWNLLKKFFPNILDDSYCHKSLFEQGIMDIWGNVLVLAMEEKIAGVVNHKPSMQSENAWEKQYSVDVIGSSGDIVRVTDSKYGVSFFPKENHESIPFFEWDGDQPLEEFVPGSVISLDCSRVVDRLLMAAAEFTGEFKYIPSIAYSRIQVLKRLSWMTIKLLNKLSSHKNLAWEEESVFRVKYSPLKQAPFEIPKYPIYDVNERNWLKEIVRISKKPEIIEASKVIEK